MSALAAGAGFARLVDVDIPGASESVVRLPRGRFRRPRRMRLRLTPWWPGGRPRALVELVPEGHVKLTSRYFEEGHRWLDELIESWGLDRGKTRPAPAPAWSHPRDR